MEAKELFQKELEETRKSLLIEAEAKADAKVEAKLAEVNKTIEELKARPEIKAEDIAKLQLDLNATIKAVDMVQVKLMARGGKVEGPETLVDVVEKNKKEIGESIKSKGKEHSFEVKTDALRASVVGNQAALEVPGIGQLAHRKLTVYDMFAKIPVGKDNNGVVRYVDWNDATKTRAAAAIAETGTFPESKAEWATYTLTLKKVGDTIPMSEEFAYDSAMFAAELQNFLNVNLAIKIDTDLISADGTGNNIAGLLTQVGTYAAAASGITDASIFDLIPKVVESISASYGSKYQPNVALMNITDINRMKLKKDLNNNYVLPPFVTNGGATVDGILVMECNAITANTMVLGDSRYGKIYEEPGVQIATTNSNGTDFVEDMMLMKARKRLNLLIRTVDQTGWKKVTDIDAALATLAS